MDTSLPVSAEFVEVTGSGPQVPAPRPAPCWNAQGVYGNGTCPQLAQYIHCRNCPVYTSAALQLLDRALPPELRREWTEHFAKPRTTRPATILSAVLFRIGEEWLALPTQVFHEVAERRSIHSLPHRRQGLVLGLANVRGELLICVSLGHLLGLQKLASRETLQNNYDRLLVLQWDGSRLGFPVDEVHGPLRFRHDELKTPPATVAKANPTFIQHIVYYGDRAAGVLDSDCLFRALNERLG
jgi:chemotaxis-related protein WspD